MIDQITIDNLSARYNKKQNFISNNINFTINSCEIMAIMGPSGSGKSTLLKAVLGTISLEKNCGKIFINNKDVTHKGLSIINHKVGYVPQDDILIDELTIKENIKSFHTIAIDSNYSKDELDSRIKLLLDSLNLNVKEQLENKKINEISGGQRKRVNIAMELINEPDILIIDEPTSGLSSLDSLDLLNYLRDYASKGKIVIIIIHQPSADVYKIFDNLLLLNDKGECVFSGKKEYLPSYSNKHYSYDTYPDKVMLSIEENNIERFHNANVTSSNESIPEKDNIRHIKEVTKDFYTLIKRHFLIRVRDKMSQMITLAVPPILAILISIVFKFSNEGQDYSFSQNGLYGQFLFMMIISGIFLGLVGSVTEIIRDRRMLEREVLRGLSTTNYYFSKLLVTLLFGLIQALLFVIVAMYMLKAQDYIYPNLIIMFFTLSMSIALGLLVSMLVKTTVAAYNLIPLLLIPQIILGGAFLPFSNMGKEIYLWEDRGSQMPLMAKVIPATWIYEYAMTLNYEYSEDKKLEKNINILQLTSNKTNDFLSLSKDETFPFWLNKLFEDTDKNKTFIYNINIIIIFLTFFILSAWIWIGANYSRNNVLRVILQIGLISIAYFIPIYLVKPTNDAIIKNQTSNDNKILLGNNKEEEEDVVITPTLKYWYEADAFCKNKNMSLASIDNIIEKINSNKIPKGIYWTDEKYSNDKSVYWTINFTKFKENEYPLNIEKVRKTKNVMVAYKQNTYLASGLCIKK